MAATKEIEMHSARPSGSIGIIRRSQVWVELEFALIVAAAGKNKWGQMKLSVPVNLNPIH
jgi:hypothetical protein